MERVYSQDVKMGGDVDQGEGRKEEDVASIMAP